MKKVINFRPFLIAFVAIIVGCVITPSLIFSFNILTIILASLFGVFLIILIAVKKLKFRKVAIIFLLFFVIGLSGSSIAINSLRGYGADIPISDITATVTDSIVERDDGSTVIILRDVKVNGKKRGGKLQATIRRDHDLTAGDRIEFRASIRGRAIVQNGKVDGNMVRSGIRGYTTINTIDNVRQGRANIFEAIRIHAKSVIDKGLGEGQEAQLSYSSLFGDRSYLDTEYYEQFKQAGGAHLLAVSGMHVAILVAVLGFFLKLFRAGKKTKLGINVVFLLLFCFLCGFTPSVVRASIMIIVYMLAGFFGRERDPLQTLSFAGLIILLFSPLSIFDIGFVLSFACVFSILCLGIPLARFLTNKIKIPKKLATLIAFSTAVFVGTFFVLAFYFGNIDMISPVSNMFLIPVYLLWYGLHFPFVVISMIIPPIAAIMWVPGIVLTGFLVIVNLFAKVPTVVLNVSMLVVMLSALLTFFASGYIKAGKKTKGIGTAVIACLMIVLLVVPNIAQDMGQGRIYVTQSYAVVASAKDTQTISIVNTLDSYSATQARIAASRQHSKQSSIVLVYGNRIETKYLRKGQIAVGANVFAESDSRFADMSAGGQFVQGGITISYYEGFGGFFVVVVGQMGIIVADRVSSIAQIEYMAAQTAQVDLIVTRQLSVSTQGVAQLPQILARYTNSEQSESVVLATNLDLDFRKQNDTLSLARHV